MTRATYILLGLSFGALPRGANASPAYPVTLQSELGLRAAPPCTLCHATELGGANTVTTRFGRTMLRNGLTGNGNLVLLRSTLNELLATGADSDGDGSSDWDELRIGSDPSEAATRVEDGGLEGDADAAVVDVGQVPEPPTPLTGCSATGARHRVSFHFVNVALWLLALAGLLLGRRCARARERREFGSAIG